MRRIITILALLAEHVVVIASLAGGIHVSFLNDYDSRESTLEILQHAGCPGRDIDVLRRAIIHYYDTPFNYDMSAFPVREKGFYSFDSAVDFVDALSTNRLSRTKHMFEYNCLDTVLFIAGHEMKASADFTAISSPYLAIATRTNGTEQLVPVASLQDVYNTAYPEWYQSFRAGIAGRDLPQEYKTIAASLYQLPGRLTAARAVCLAQRRKERKGGGGRGMLNVEAAGVHNLDVER